MGGVFYILHWPGSSLLFLIALAVINFGYLPFLLYRINNKPGDEVTATDPSYKLRTIFGFVGLALFLTASIFKFLHYPGSAIL